MRKLFTGTLASAAIQRKDPKTGKIGYWLFTGDSCSEVDARVSPVFGDVFELHRWALKHDWEPINSRYRYAGVQ